MLCANVSHVIISARCWCCSCCSFCHCCCCYCVINVVDILSQTYGTYAGQKQVVRVQKDFSMATHFSDREERSLWEQESSFPDETIMERCLCTRALGNLDSSPWPVVFDPYHQFEAYLRALSKYQMEKSMGEGAHLATIVLLLFLFCYCYCEQRL